MPKWIVMQLNAAKICIVIVGPSIEEVKEQIQQASLYADLIELRLDLFLERDAKTLKNLLNSFAVPMLFTLRSESQGGKYKGNQEEYISELKKLAECQPSYLDLESHLSESTCQDFAHNFPTIKLLISYHQFNPQYQKLDDILDRMPKIRGAFFKVALSSPSTTSTLQWMIEAKKHQDLVFVAMGEHGEISRILSPAFSNPFTYASLDDEKMSAPGQLSIQTLQEIYRYKHINSYTKLFGLIGDPITGSIGHQTNNVLMQALGLNARYVKMKIEAAELKTALPLLKELGFQGMAVTMPLKEAILSYIDELDFDAKSCGAVNTIVFDGDRLKGYNKDGQGALDCLETFGSVKGKRVFLLGGGGAARAIAVEAIHRGAHVTIFNRTLDKAKTLAAQLGCACNTLESVHQDYDVLVNCLPFSVNLSLDPACFQKEAIVMDITTKPVNTNFLVSAKKAGCRIVYGYQMFIAQTLLQFNEWFPGKIHQENASQILRQSVQNVLY